MRDAPHVLHSQMHSRIRGFILFFVRRDAGKGSPAQTSSVAYKYDDFTYASGEGCEGWSRIYEAICVCATIFGREQIVYYASSA